MAKESGSAPSPLEQVLALFKCSKASKRVGIVCALLLAVVMALKPTFGCLNVENPQGDLTCIFYLTATFPNAHSPSWQSVLDLVLSSTYEKSRTAEALATSSSTSGKTAEVN